MLFGGHASRRCARRRFETANLESAQKRSDSGKTRCDNRDTRFDHGPKQGVSGRVYPFVSIEKLQVSSSGSYKGDHLSLSGLSGT